MVYEAKRSHQKLAVLFYRTCLNEIPLFGSFFSFACFSFVVVVLFLFFFLWVFFDGLLFVCLFCFEMHWQFTVQELPSFTDVQDINEKAWGGLLLLCLSLMEEFPSTSL